MQKGAKRKRGGSFAPPSKRRVLGLNSELALPILWIIQCQFDYGRARDIPNALPTIEGPQPELTDCLSWSPRQERREETGTNARSQTSDFYIWELEIPNSANPSCGPTHEQSISFDAGQELSSVTFPSPGGQVHGLSHKRRTPTHPCPEDADRLLGTVPSGRLPGLHDPSLGVGQGLELEDSRLLKRGLGA